LQVTKNNFINLQLLRNLILFYHELDIKITLWVQRTSTGKNLGGVMLILLCVSVFKSMCLQIKNMLCDTESQGTNCTLWIFTT